LLDVNAYAKALEAYWAVRSRDTVAAMQRDRITLIERRMAQNIANAGKDPTKNVAAAQRTNTSSPAG
jgi:alcohol dehydrogenase class IV